MKSVDYYQILGLAQGASTSEIRARYKVLAKKHHPDHDGDNNLMGLINEAYRVLSDPKLRLKYNQELNNDKPAVTNRTEQQPQHHPAPKTGQQQNRAAKARKTTRGFWTVLALAVFGVLLLGSYNLWKLGNATPTTNAPTYSKPTIKKTKKPKPSNRRVKRLPVTNAGQ